jgi:hypothetical protein
MFRVEKYVLDPFSFQQSIHPGMDIADPTVVHIAHFDDRAAEHPLLEQVLE